MPSAPEVGEYEQQRLDNIARNRSTLEKLGLDSHPRPLARKTAPPRKRPRNQPKPAVAPALPTRRSSRNAGKPSPNYWDPQVRDLPVGWDRDSSRSRSGSQAQPAAGGDDQDDVVDMPRPHRARPTRPAPTKPTASQLRPDSSMNMMADVEGALKTLAGEEMPQTGKAPVMQAMSANGKLPRYNKYSGVVEWVNCVMLWVNIGHDNGYKYTNTFLDQGRSMTWFGGSRHHEATPVIQRLIGEKGKRGKKSPVLLFCRLDKSGYVCMGRLGYESHNAGRHPIGFLWELLDHGLLHKKPGFQAIVTMAHKKY